MTAWSPSPMMRGALLLAELERYTALESEYQVRLFGKNEPAISIDGLRFSKCLGVPSFDDLIRSPETSLFHQTHQTARVASA